MTRGGWILFRAAGEQEGSEPAELLGQKSRQQGTCAEAWEACAEAWEDHAPGVFSTAARTRAAWAEWGGRTPWAGRSRGAGKLAAAGC